MPDAGIGAAPGADIGTAIVAYIEPHDGHAREFNRWYERDHFPAAVMAGPGAFAGARFVATRACKAARPACARFGPAERGSYLALAWLLPDAQAEWDAWVPGRLDALASAGRMFPHRDHLHTAVYTCGVEVRAPGGPPAAQALDRCFGGVVVVAALLAGDSETPAVDAVDEWSRRLVGDDVPVAVVLRPERLVTSTADPAGRDFHDHALVVGFVEGDVLDVWREVVAPAVTSLGAAAVPVGFASPFLRTVPGTDTYADDL